MPVAQVNEALSDKPSGKLDHSMRVETDQVLHVGQRLTLCMARCAMKAFAQKRAALSSRRAAAPHHHCMHGFGWLMPMHARNLW